MDLEEIKIFCYYRKERLSLYICIVCGKFYKVFLLGKLNLFLRWWKYWVYYVNLKEVLSNFYIIWSCILYVKGECDLVFFVKLK